MKPIPPIDLPKYFWRGDTDPTLTTGIPVGAMYINKTTGANWTLSNSGWRLTARFDPAENAGAGALALQDYTVAGNVAIV